MSITTIKGNLLLTIEESLFKSPEKVSKILTCVVIILATRFINLVVKVMNIHEPCEVRTCQDMELKRNLNTLADKTCHGMCCLPGRC